MCDCRFTRLTSTRVSRTHSENCLAALGVWLALTHPLLALAAGWPRWPSP
jgi:hypothetical protein